MFLGDKCIEGLVWLKFICGFMLKVRGIC